MFLAIAKDDGRRQAPRPARAPVLSLPSNLLYRMIKYQGIFFLSTLYQPLTSPSFPDARDETMSLMSLRRPGLFSLLTASKDSIYVSLVGNIKMCPSRFPFLFFFFWCVCDFLYLVSSLQIRAAADCLCSRVSSMSMVNFLSFPLQRRGNANSEIKSIIQAKRTTMAV